MDVSSLQQLIKTSIECYRNQKALNEMTYDDLESFFFKKKEVWASLGVSSGDLIVIKATKNKQSTILNILSALRFGIIPVVVHIESTADFVERCIKMTNAKLFVEREEQAVDSAPSPCPCEYEETKLLFCTSGTTGDPKLVSHTDSSILNNIRGILSYIDLNMNDNLLIIRPPSNLSVVTGEILLGLALGCHLHTYEKTIASRTLVESMIELKINCLVSVPAIIHSTIPYISRHKNQFSELRYLKFVGEAVSSTTLDQLIELLPYTEVLNCYGMTETGPRLTYWSSKKHKLLDHCVGHPLPGVRIRITDNHGADCDFNEKGIVLVSSKSTMIGYWGNAPHDGEWLTTKDWGWKNEEGLIFIVGRADDLIIRGGMKISPTVIEGLLLKHPFIIDAFVRGRKYRNYDVCIEAFVVLSANADENERSLLSWAQTCLTSTIRPQKIHIVKSLRDTKVAKLNRTREVNEVRSNDKSNK